MCDFSSLTRNQTFIGRRSQLLGHQGSPKKYCFYRGNRKSSSKALWLEAFSAPQTHQAPKCPQPINREKPTLKTIGVNICYGLAVLRTNRMWEQRQSSASGHDTPPTHTAGRTLLQTLRGGWRVDSVITKPGRPRLAGLWLQAIQMSLDACRK